MRDAETSQPIVVDDVAVIIASTGRREVLAATLQSLRVREYVPGIAVLVGADPEDLPERAAFPDRFKFVLAPRKGLTVQRNYGVACLGTEVKYIAFLDDDMEVSDKFVLEVSNVFATRSDVAAFSGNVILNGNVTREDARRQLDGEVMPDGMPPFGELHNGWSGLYGCAMCVRVQIPRNEPFDEDLPLYALGEDMEAGFRFRKYGKVGGSARCVVAHLAVTKGRVSELRVGYSQVANYVHFWKKRIGYTWKDLVFRQLLPSVAANLTYTVLPMLDRRHNIDRRGRLRGNLAALLDLCRGKLSPRRILELQ